MVMQTRSKRSKQSLDKDPDLMVPDVMAINDLLTLILMHAVAQQTSEDFSRYQTRDTWAIFPSPAASAAGDRHLSIDDRHLKYSVSWGMLRVVQWKYTTKAFRSAIQLAFPRLLQVFYEQVFKELQSTMQHRPTLREMRLYLNFEPARIPGPRFAASGLTWIGTRSEQLQVLRHKANLAIKTCCLFFLQQMQDTAADDVPSLLGFATWITVYCKAAGLQATVQTLLTAGQRTKAINEILKNHNWHMLSSLSANGTSLEAYLDNVNPVDINQYRYIKQGSFMGLLAKDGETTIGMILPFRSLYDEDGDARPGLFTINVHCSMFRSPKHLTDIYLSRTAWAALIQKNEVLRAHYYYERWVDVYSHNTFLFHHKFRAAMTWLKDQDAQGALVEAILLEDTGIDVNNREWWHMWTIYDLRPQGINPGMVRYNWEAPYLPDYMAQYLPGRNLPLHC
jgi:hypothetical protein